MAQEKNFENKVKKYLESIGVYAIGTGQHEMQTKPIGYYEKRWGGGYSKAGLPDMHIVVNAINIDIELKASNGRPSDLQKQKIMQINGCDSIGIILYPDGFENFKELIEKVMKCNIPIQELNCLKNAISSTKCNILTK